MMALYLAFIPNGKLLVSGLDDKIVKLGVSNNNTEHYVKSIKTLFTQNDIAQKSAYQVILPQFDNVLLSFKLIA